jgi:hypothetical protein
MDIPCAGRSTTSIGSPARTTPGETTRRYAPGRFSCANRFTQRGSRILAWKVAQGIRPNVGSSTSSSPIRHCSPITAPLTSTPVVVRLSPNSPPGSSRLSCSCHQS